MQSEVTKTVHSSRLRVLTKLLGNLDFTNSDHVIAKINEAYTNPNTRKSYFSAIVTELRKENPPNLELIQKITVPMNASIKIVNDNIEKNEMSDKQEKNWVDYDKIIELRDKLAILAVDFQSYQNYLILALYTMIPPLRADFA